MNEKISYFIIAFAIYLLGKSFFFFAMTPPIYLVCNLAIAFSLLCNNIPRVIYMQPRHQTLIRKLEYISLAVAIVALLMMFTL